MANTNSKLSLLTQPDLKDRITRLYKEGLSYTEIGEKVGGNRNQIAGLVNRLRKAGVITEGREKLPQPPRRITAPKKPKAVEPEPEPFVELFDDAVFGTNVSLIELGPRQCRYPVYSNGSSHLFCGEMDTGDTCYCQTHKDVCIVPAKIAPKKQGFRRY